MLSEVSINIYKFEKQKYTKQLTYTIFYNSF